VGFIIEMGNGFKVWRTPPEPIQAMGSATVPQILVPQRGEKYDF
jgi:hypothetical protein